LAVIGVPLHVLTLPIQACGSRVRTIAVVWAGWVGPQDFAAREERRGLLVPKHRHSAASACSKADALRRRDSFGGFHLRGHTTQATTANTPHEGAISVRKFTALSSLQELAASASPRNHNFFGNLILPEAAMENSDNRSERNHK